MAFFAHRYSKKLIASAEKIEQSEEIKYHIREIQAITVEMESGIRGYVLTGDEHYVDPPSQALADVFLHLRDLGVSAGITAQQKTELDQLTKLVDEKSIIDSRIIEVRRQKGMSEALTLINAGEEKTLMKQIRDLSVSMIAKEDQRLTTRKAENRKFLGHFAIAFYFLLIKISITVITVVTLLVMYFRKRNKDEKILKANQELFHNVLDHTASVISIKDLAGRYMLVNKSFQQLFGIKENLILGKTAHDLVDKEAAEHIRNTDLDVLRSQQQIKVEEVVEQQGKNYHFESLKFPLLDVNGIPYAICSISTNEAERIALESQHREQMKRMLDLFNNAPCGYQASDANGIVLEMNDTFLKWLGYTRQEVIGKLPVRNLISKESLDTFSYYFPKLLSGEIHSVFDVEVTYVRKDGSKMVIVANSVGQYDEEGKFLYTRTSLFDISYRKRIEELVTHN